MTLLHNITKLCVTCECVFALTMFPKNNRKADGYGIHCKNCHNKKAKAYRDANPEKVKLIRMAHYKKEKPQSDLSGANRRIAVSLGIPTYTGKACGKCGNTERYVAQSNCVKCSREFMKTAAQKDRVGKWRDANPRSVSAHRIMSYNKRRNREKLATPQWLTAEQRKEMIQFIKNRPNGYHVDHIHPLAGKNACGLNVPWNLQYLTAQENLKKGNR